MTATTTTIEYGFFTEAEAQTFVASARTAFGCEVADPQFDQNERFAIRRWKVGVGIPAPMTEPEARKAVADSIQPIDVAKVTRVYSGRDGKCCCGCSGNYYEARTLTGQPMVVKVVRLINQAILSGDHVDREADHVAWVTASGRLYVAYFCA